MRVIKFNEIPDSITNRMYTHLSSHVCGLVLLRDVEQLLADKQCNDIIIHEGATWHTVLYIPSIAKLRIS